MSDAAAEEGPLDQPDEPPRHLPVPTTQTVVEAAPPQPLERFRAAEVPAAAVAAAGGFVAGVVTFVLARVLRRRHAHRSVGRALARPRRRDGLDVAGTRSFLVDIHLLRR